MPIPLLEPSARETARRIRRKLLAIDGVKECEVLTDSAGKKPHVGVRIILEGNPGYERIHGISSMADHEVRRIVPNARVSIRSEPETGGKDQGLWALVRRVADNEPGSRGAHNMHLQNVGGKLGVDFHLEVSSGVSAKEAHGIAIRIEKKIKAADPKISEVEIHTETTSDRVSNERLGHGSELRWYIDHVFKRFPDARLAGPALIRRIGEGQLHVTVHASFSPNMSAEMTNQAASNLGSAIKDGYPGIVRVDIVREPEGKAGERSMDAARE